LIAVAGNLVSCLLYSLSQDAKFALQLLQVRARVSEARANGIHIGAHCVQTRLNLTRIAAQTTLFTLDEIDLLRLDASPQPNETACDEPNRYWLHRIFTL
jgi:hypothetical protein